MGGDLEKLSEREFDELFTQVTEEYYRRQRKAGEAQQLAELQAAHVAERDGVRPDTSSEPDGGPATEAADWVKPESSLANYPERWIVKHAGALWRSKVPDNSSEPGADNGSWERLELDPEAAGAGPDAQEWEPEHPYVVGDRVLFYGDLFTAKVAHVSSEGVTPWNQSYWEQVE